MTEMPFTSECPTCHDDGEIPIPVDGGGPGDFDVIPCPNCKKETASTLQVEAA